MIKQLTPVAAWVLLLLPPMVVGPLRAQELATARTALAAHDTAGALHILERAVGELPLSPEALGSLFLLDWIGRSPATPSKESQLATRLSEDQPRPCSESVLSRSDTWSRPRSRSTRWAHGRTWPGAP
jgi:hypothetical protein